LTLFGANTRDELRQAYSDAWRKQTGGMPLTPLEAMIAGVIGLHPEYHALVSDPAKVSTHETAAASGLENPFLHLGLHMAVREQLAIDRPPGVRALRARLAAHFGDPHRAEHDLMDALAETLWEAQRSGHPPDEIRYLDRARQKLALAGWTSEH
jgi:hypothetical protein